MERFKKQKLIKRREADEGDLGENTPRPMRDYWSWWTCSKVVEKKKGRKKAESTTPQRQKRFLSTS